MRCWAGHLRSQGGWNRWDLLFQTSFTAGLAHSHACRSLGGATLCHGSNEQDATLARRIMWR